MKAYNVWKYNNKDITNATEGLICKIGSEYGYSVGAQGSYTLNGSNEYYTGNNSIEAGPNNIFMTAGTFNYWWWASPCSANNRGVLRVNGYRVFVGNGGNDNGSGVCPVVSI